MLCCQRAKIPPVNRGYEPSRVVHLRNLPEDIDMDDVMELGRPFGPVISALRIKETQVLIFFCGEKVDLWLVITVSDIHC